MIDLTPIVQAVLAVLAALITAFVIPWIKAKATVQQRELLERGVKTAVFAAEQVYGSGWGRDKMRYAEEYLRKRVYAVDIDLIEATVREYFGHDTLPEVVEDPAEDEESDEDEEPQTPLMSEGVVRCPTGFSGLPLVIIQTRHSPA
jgi:hypothetical protein